MAEQKLEQSPWTPAGQVLQHQEQKRANDQLHSDGMNEGPWAPMCRAGWWETTFPRFTKPKAVQQPLVLPTPNSHPPVIRQNFPPAERCACGRWLLPSQIQVHLASNEHAKVRKFLSFKFIFLARNMLDNFTYLFR